MRERPPVPAHLRFEERADELRGLELDQLFARIYETNLWSAEESRSGTGSVLDQTARLRAELPVLLRSLGATTLLDVPCGDFGWMSHVDLAGIRYLGADIVREVIASNQALHGGADCEFLCLDLTRDALPRADVVLCRDCLVHLSFDNIRRAVENVNASGSTYLLTTTFLDHQRNEDIANGDWRMLNFEQPPFAFGPPLHVIVEGCTESDGAYSDKSLGLWRLPLRF